MISFFIVMYKYLISQEKETKNHLELEFGGKTK